ncbi:unnamed protein product, partial [Iphiclides podalirius]
MANNQNGNINKMGICTILRLPFTARNGVAMSIADVITHTRSWDGALGRPRHNMLRQTLHSPMVPRHSSWKFENSALQLLLILTPFFPLCVEIQPGISGGACSVVPLSVAAASAGRERERAKRSVTMIVDCKGRQFRRWTVTEIEEVMQQKAPGVPDKVQQIHAGSNAQGVRKRLSANFFKATFSSRSKAVSTAVSSRSVEDTTKIGSAETKPVTRTRPRSVSQLEDAKSKAKRGVERSKPVNRSDRPLYPERPLRAKQQAAATTDQKSVYEHKPQYDLKSPNVVFQIVKKSVTPKQDPKTPDSILPPSLKPKIPDKTKLKLTKLINNNHVWSNANIEKDKKAPQIPSR